MEIIQMGCGGAHRDKNHLLVKHELAIEFKNKI